MGEAVVFEVTKVCGVMYFGVYTGLAKIVLLKKLFSLINYAGAKIYGYNRDVRLNDGAIDKKESKDIPAATAADVDNAFKLGKGEGGVSSS